MDSKLDINIEYYTQKIIGDQNIRFKLLQIIDENSILKFQNKPDKPNLQILITCQLFQNQVPVTVERHTKLVRKMFIQETLEIPYKYMHLNYHAFLAFTIWSLDQNYDEKRPVGTTIVSLFDDKLRLREGKYNLVIWPDRLADITLNSSTPGLLKDYNIEDLNYYGKKLENFERHFSGFDNTQNNKCFQALINQVFYGYKKIPAAFLEIEFPIFDKPVLYEEIDLLIDQNLPEAVRVKKEIDDLFYETAQYSNNFLFADYDFEFEKFNPVQNLNMQLLRDDDENAREIKPNKEQIEMIEKILVRPIFGELESENKNLLWKFRYFLIGNKFALTKFLHCVTWNKDKECVEALSLFDKWIKIELDEAISLLSAYFCCNEIYNRNKKPIEPMIKIRQYAVDIMKEYSMERISSIALQLVQALRYEKLDESSALLNFLIEAGVKNLAFAIELYWHFSLETEINNKQICEFYKLALSKFQEELQKTVEGNKILEVIYHQKNFRDYLIKLNFQVKKCNKTDARTSELRKILNDPNHNRFHPHLLCLEPNIKILSFIPEKCSVFKSAMAPFLFTIKATHSDAESEHGMNETFSYKVMFKNGDDLMQDQLILQIIALIDSFLKKINIDLKLTPYKVMANGKDNGFVEFVAESKTLQDVLKEHDSKMTPFLKKLAKNAAEISSSWFYKKYPNDINIGNPQTLEERAYQRILENYISSCAGYCVITYILGIGDRHLENLMINEEGKFLHIDFGWILGNDPKISPPPFKLCKEMVEGFGGDKSPGYEEFKKKCVETFHKLREYAKLIINLFHLMIDSGLKDLDIKRLEILYEKFRLDVNDETAEKQFLDLIEESKDAVWSVVFDKFHIFAGYLK